MKRDIKTMSQIEQKYKRRILVDAFITSYSQIR